MGIKKIIKKFLLGKGYEIFRRYYYDFNADDSIQKILKHVGINFNNIIILDVGANVGQSVDRFRRYMPNSKIFSFEPNPEVFSKLLLKEKIDKNLKCFNLGVGSIKKTIPFFINPDSGSNSFYKINLDGDSFALSHSEEAKKNHNKTTLKQTVEYNTEINVPVDTLNNICNSENINNIDILKIDTQGYEEEVLKGADSILSNTLIVEAEVMFGDSYEKSSTLRGIESQLHKFGFILWEIPYIGKFATDDFNRINFIDVQFVNMNLVNLKIKNNVISR